MKVLKCRPGFLWCLVFALVLAAIPRNRELTTESFPLPTSPADQLPRTEVVEDTIQRNTTLVATLVDYKIPVAVANELADLIKPVFDVRKLRSGNPFRLEKEIDGTLKAFEYKIDDESVLKVEKEAGSLPASRRFTLPTGWQ